MNTWHLKDKLQRKLKRRVHTCELEEIAVELGKSRPPRGRTGTPSYEWNEEEIPLVIDKLLLEA